MSLQRRLAGTGRAGPGRSVCGVLPAVVQEVRGKHGDEDVLPVHREEQGGGGVDTRG